MGEPLRKRQPQLGLTVWDRLTDLMPPAKARTWLGRKNPAIGKTVTPAELLARGDERAVHALIDGIEAESPRHSV